MREEDIFERREMRLFRGPIFVHIVIEIMQLIQRAIFPAYDSVCLCVFHKCYVCAHLYVVDVC